MATTEGEGQEENVEGEDLTNSGLELKKLLNRAESDEVRPADQRRVVFPHTSAGLAGSERG
jgi:hypothetical protein